MTVSNHPLPEVVSALQKCIRRSLVDDALYWATEMDLSGYGEYCWRRLLIITSEDVGVASAALPATIRALYENWKEARGKPNAPDRLFLVHAVVLLAQSPKSRLMDNALMVHYAAHEELRRPVPDFALDQHTYRGRQRRRGAEHFFDEGSWLDPPPDVPDPYQEFARSLAVHGREPSLPRRAGQPPINQPSLEEADGPPA